MLPSLFGEVDLHPKTRMPASAYPAWFFRAEIENLKESIRHNRMSIDNGWVSAANLPQARVDLDKQEKKLAQIIDSIPKVTDKELDQFDSLWAEASELLKPLYHSRSDMTKGVASPHEIVHRMKDQCVPIRGELLNFCKASGCIIVDGKTSGDDIARAWQILGSFLGKNTNTETLRKD